MTLNNLKKKLIFLLNKLASKKYLVAENKENKFNLCRTTLLINSLSDREKIYNFSKNYTVSKGISESYFLSYLNTWFNYPWRILENCQFQEENYAFTADFILINDHFKLGIDLEIDEPYTLKDGLPIHLVEDSKYIFRDKFFLGLGYIVVRFAEYQIAKYPDNCCLHIVKVLNQFLEPELNISIPSTAKILSLSSQDWRVKAWNQQESKTMASDKIRELYLQPVRSFNSSFGETQG